MLMYFKIARLDIKYPVVSEKFYAKNFFSNLPQEKWIGENLSAPKVIWLRSMQVRKNILDFVLKVHRIISLSPHEHLLLPIIRKQKCVNFHRKFADLFGNNITKTADLAEKEINILNI